MASNSCKHKLLDNGECVVIEASVKPTAALIFLHGNTLTGYASAEFIDRLEIPPHVIVICPTAPLSPVTILNGQSHHSWFDVKMRGTGLSSEEDEPGMRLACKDIHGLIDAVSMKYTIPTDRIILGGMSQGGSLALYSGLTFSKPLGGLLLLSCLMRLRDIIPGEALELHKTLPIFHAHGTADDIIVFERGQDLNQYLSGFTEGADSYRFHVYQGLDHWFCKEEEDDITRWLHKTSPPLHAQL